MPFTQNSTPTFVKQPKRGMATFQNADGTTKKTVVTPGANGSKVVALYASSTDSASKNAFVIITRASAGVILGKITIPATSGTGGVSALVDLLNSTVFPTDLLAVDADGRKYLFLESGDTLDVQMESAVTTATAIYFHADYGDF